MLFKNNMRPALATAGASGADSARGKKANDIFTRAEIDEDFNAFGKGAEKPRTAPNRQGGSSQNGRPSRPSRPPQRRRKPATNFSWKPVLFAGLAVVALILVIVILIAIFAAPKKNIKLEDDIYFTYVDSDGKYRLVSNNNVLKDTFDGELEIVPAKDASFAYVYEKISEDENSGYKMYLLDGKKLTPVEATADSKPLAVADYEPGIVYKQNGRTYYYSKDDQVPITGSDTADNFMISGDAKTVVYTIESSNKDGQYELRYFCNGGSAKVGPYNFVPSAISNDGKYIYGIFRNVLCYITVKDNGKTYDNGVIANNTFGEILSITGMNVDGNEIIFCAQPANKLTPVSYMYKIGDSEPKQIADGVFTPIYADSKIVCPETFLNSYFICQKEVMDEEGDTSVEVATYFLDKKEGARKMADTVGRFSPDKKYFYFIDEDRENSLMQLKLNSKDFSDGLYPVLSDVVDFDVTESGNIYAMIDARAKDGNKGIIYFWDRSDKKTKLSSDSADLDSMKICVNSAYFSETNEDGSTKVYISTEGSAKKEVEFKSANLTATPEIVMGAGKKGYAYFIDKDGSTKLFYTSNGKKFSSVCNSCKIAGFTKEPEASPEDAE